MRILLALLLALPGAWYLITAVIAVSTSARADAPPTPLPWTSLLLGVLLLTGATLLWRSARSVRAAA